MFLQNLSLPELLTLLGAVSSVVVTLYLLDRSRRRQKVATLRFWTHALQPTAAQRRRRIQQPWSLLLQLVSLALLLLALAQLRWGTREQASRDYVVLLDTSSWMAARAGQGTLMDEARRTVKQYVQAIPPADRVMLIRADAVATPATAFEVNRAKVLQAIDESEPGATALRLEQALRFASQVQARAGHPRGEISYAGPARIVGAEVPANLPVNLRVLPTAAPGANVGLRKLGLQRAPESLGQWTVAVYAHNYGAQPVTVPLALRFGKALVGMKQVTLPPGVDQETTFPLRTEAAGLLEAYLMTNDALPDDNRAMLEVPAQHRLQVVVYSDEPTSLKPLFASHPQVQAEYLSPAQYAPGRAAQVVVCDRFSPAALPSAALILIAPPMGRSPIPVRTVLHDAALTRWEASHPLATGIRTKTVRLEQATVFRPEPGDVVVAEVGERQPVVVARESKSKTVVIGFHPGKSAMQYELATPLLFANILNWVAPETFRQWDLNSGSVGTTTLRLPREEAADQVRVVADNKALPFSLQGQTLSFFSSDPGIVRVKAGDRETVYSLTLPEVADATWTVPAQIPRGVPHFPWRGAASRDIWQWLAAAGALGLVLEWFLYGRARARLATQKQRVYSSSPAESVRRAS